MSLFIPVRSDQLNLEIRGFDSRSSRSVQCRRVHFESKTWLATVLFLDSQFWLFIEFFMRNDTVVFSALVSCISLGEKAIVDFAVCAMGAFHTPLT